MNHDAFAAPTYSTNAMDHHALPPSALTIRKHPVPSIDTNVQHNIVHHTQITPPDTPVVAEAAGEEENGIVFHNYLRAFYPFDPHTNLPGNDEAIRSAVSLHAGDVILIHTIHANGWADGTVLTTGERGWLPTNYCEPYDHPYLRQLLTAMTQFWDLLGGSEGANLGTFIRQDYIRGLIAGVRHLLEHADCLHRDASRVQRHTGVRRMRKGLLADLSTLVQIAKRLQETVSEAYADQTIHVLLDDLMTKAFKVVTRAVGFVDIWTSETAQEKTRLQALASIEPVTPPIDDRGVADSPNIEVYGRAVSSSEPINADHHTPQLDGHPEINPNKRSSWRPVSASFRKRKNSVAHRLSYVTSPVSRSASSILASEQLAKVHDICISHIGAFIGHQLHARPTSEMTETTNKLIKACMDMLTIIDEVRSFESQATVSVEGPQRNLREKLTELETKLATANTAEDSDEIVTDMSGDLGADMVQLGTGLIRVAGEAVAKTRSLIEQIGDFDLERPPFPLLRHEAESPTIAASTEPSSPRSPNENRLSQKPLPLPPTLAAPILDSIVQSKDLAVPASPAETPTPLTPFSAISYQSVPAQFANRHTAPSVSSVTNTPTDIAPSTIRPVSASPLSDDHVFQPVSNVLSVSSSITTTFSARDSATTTTSETSTRATTPDHTKDNASSNPTLLNSFCSMSSFHSTSAETEADSDLAESQFLQHTYANELTLNKDGQISGGSLSALVEQLTTHDTAPDARFVSAFFITFRLFATPCELAQALIARFDYIGESKNIGVPVRLRVCNVFKGWLETYWSVEADRDALDGIRGFASDKLRPVLQVAGERLVELVRRITDGYANGTLTGPLVSAMGKDGMPVAQSDHSTASAPVISKSQLSTLRNGGNCTIVDLDPLEIARQLTLVASKVFCDIQPDELLGLEWCKKNSTTARNVRALCNLNTDVANVVSDSILAPDNAKQRASVIKHWTKVAKHCLELNNYETLMAVTCSLNLSVVQRLKRTWQLVSKNTKDRLDELNTVIDMSRNQASLRKRLEEAPAPCLPFLGLYLTDLTFVDAGNPKTRELPGSASETGEPVTVINFDKYMRTARIISSLRRFQVPFKIQPVPELQAWIEGHMERMRSSNEQMVGSFHRRSLILEPKQDDARARGYSVASAARSQGDYTRNNSVSSIDDRARLASMPQPESVQVVREKFGSFLKHNAFAFKVTSSPITPTETLSPVEEVP